MFENDYREIIAQDLLNPSKRLELATAINTLCQKYFISFEMVLRKVLFKSYKAQEYKNIRAEIDKLTGKVSNYFDSNSISQMIITITIKNSYCHI